MIYNYNNEDKLIAAVDCIIFGFNDNGLKILLVKRAIEPEKGKWSLIGGFLKKNETLDESAKRVLDELTGIKELYLEQLEAYSDIDRDPVTRTISIAYSALIKTTSKTLSKDFDAKWFSISKLPKLIFDHNSMVDRAMRRLRHKASTQPIGLELLPEKFTMRQLQILYETILDLELDKRNFIKKITSFDILVKHDEKDMTSSKKGSYLYSFDKKKYDKRKLEGLIFKL